MICINSELYYKKYKNKGVFCKESAFLLAFLKIKVYTNR